VNIDQMPKWLDVLERKLGWLAVPSIGILFVTLQVLGFLMVSADPIWLERLALIPSAVWKGEIWRLITFLALPLSTDFFWELIAIWFAYFLFNTLERELGSFKITLYTLISLLFTLFYALGVDYPIFHVRYFESTLLLALATLYPEYEVSIFFFIPAKLKWIGWLSIVYAILECLLGSWKQRGFFIALYLNYFLFFGMYHFQFFKQWFKKKNNKF